VLILVYAVDVDWKSEVWDPVREGEVGEVDVDEEGCDQAEN
jgi:hypothetical protein